MTKANRAADVIIIGLGAMGSAAAHHLAARGCSVIGFDQFAPPHSLGSSHGRSRIFRQSYWEDSRYVPMLLRAYELWRKLELDSGESLLHITGGLGIGHEGSPLVSRSAESARLFQLPHQVLDASEIKRRYPVFFVEPDTVALLEENAGYLDPERCVAAHLREAARLGARLNIDSPVQQWTAGPGGVTVRTAEGLYSAGQLVITAGPWAQQVLAPLDLPMRVTRQVAGWFEPVASMDFFRRDRLPVYLFESAPGQRIVYGFPLTGTPEEGVKVAIHGSDELCMADTVNREVRPADVELLRCRLEQTVPLLNGRLLHAETCLYTMTPDEHFILDAHPEMTRSMWRQAFRVTASNSPR